MRPCVDTMKVYAEVDPIGDEEKLARELRLLKSFDGLDLPDCPLGMPSMLPLAISARLRYAEDYSGRLIINQRLADVNELYVRSLVLTSHVLSLDIAFTVGDAPKFGNAVNQLNSESALRIAKEYKANSRVGLFLSLRYPREKIIERMRAGADFFLAMRVRNASDLEGLEVSKIIPYVIIATEKNKGIMDRIKQPAVTMDHLKDHIYELEGVGIRSVLLSCPGDWESLKNALNFVGRKPDLRF